MNNKIEYLRQNGVDVDSGIKNTMDEDTYNEILLDFYNNLPTEVNKLVNYLNNNDLSNYSISVHALKSNARTLGFTNFGEICYAHEIDSKSGDKDKVVSNFNTLAEESKRVYSIITNYKNM